MAKHSAAHKLGSYIKIFGTKSLINKYLVRAIFKEVISLADRDVTETDQKRYIANVKPISDANMIIFQTSRNHLVITVSEFRKTSGDKKTSGGISGKRVYAIDLDDLSVWDSVY